MSEIGQAVCPKCKASISSEYLLQGEIFRCNSCHSSLMMKLFPAFFRAAETGTTGEKTVETSQSSCFFHPDKVAVLSCEMCGRFVCALCDLDLNGKHICPTCLESGRKKGKIRDLENRRTLYDSIALGVALYPVPLFFYVTFISAPVALYIAFAHWNSPTSLLPRSKARFIIAIVFAILQCLGWLILLGIVVANLLKV